jgi:uncharacterized protein (DUF952 family)
MSSPTAATRFIFHIAFERDWQSARQHGRYRISTRGRSFSDVGFIHAGFGDQVPTVGAALYADATAPLVVLVIDTELLDVPVVVENLEGGDEGFPHIYGPLPTSAVVDVRRARVINGRFHVDEERHA